MIKFNNKQILGSKTAKSGFNNEIKIVEKFKNHRQDLQASQWLEIMGYDVNKIKKLKAVQIPPNLGIASASDFIINEKQFETTKKFKKADVQVQLTIEMSEGVIYRENISIKKATANFNQIDKRSVSTYQSMWKLSDELALLLKKFTGEIKPNSEESKNLRDSRRWYLDELPQEKVEKLLHFFKENKTLIVNDILKGRGMLAAEWFLVTKQNKYGSLDWLFKNINEVINFYAQGEIKLSEKGGLILGRITAQRKGGTPDPTSLQFKIKPLDLFKFS